MRKLKLYLDTSVISHLDALDTPEKMADTLRLWELILSGEYSVAWSDVTVAEVEDCPEPKLSKLRTHMAEVDAEIIPVNDAVTALASQFIRCAVKPPALAVGSRQWHGDLDAKKPFRLPTHSIGNDCGL
jgi:hypothetical protein